MNKPHISDLKLERLLLGALTPSEESALRLALEQDPEAQARYACLTTHDEALFHEFSPERVEAEVERRVRMHELAETPKRSVFQLLSFPKFQFAFAAAAVCLLAIAVTFIVNQPDDTFSYRVKGEPSLVIHRIEGSMAVKLAANDAAKAGDKLQLSIIGAHQKHAMVFSLDGNGQVTLHFPLDNSKGKITIDEGPYTLPHSYVLDNAPEFERFILLTGHEHIDTKHVLKQAGKFAKEIDKRATKALDDLPDHTRQFSFLIKKVK